MTCRTFSPEIRGIAACLTQITPDLSNHFFRLPTLTAPILGRSGRTPAARSSSSSIRPGPQQPDAPPAGRSRATIPRALACHHPEGLASSSTARLRCGHRDTGAAGPDRDGPNPSDTSTAALAPPLPMVPTVLLPSQSPPRAVASRSRTAHSIACAARQHLQENMDEEILYAAAEGLPSVMATQWRLFLGPASGSTGICTAPS